MLPQLVLLLLLYSSGYYQIGSLLLSWMRGTGVLILVTLENGVRRPVWRSFTGLPTSQLDFLLQLQYFQR